MNYRPDIDGLRAVAVLGVLLFHFSLGPFPGGFTGVDIFFVISGYLITRLIIEDMSKGRFSFRSFYGRRIRRLFPALCFTLVCSLVAAAFLLPPSQMTRFGLSLSASVLSVSNIFFWSEVGYFDVSAQLKPLLHTWSLSVEEQFYLLWPFALVWLMRRGKTAATIAAVLIFCASLAANLLFEPYQSALFYLAPFRFFEFALGAVLVFAPAARTNGVREGSLLIGLALIAYAFLFFDEKMLFPSYPALMPTVGACLVIYGGQAKWSGLALRNPLCVWTGLISYSLYLAHWPLLVFWQLAQPAAMTIRDRLVLLAVTLIVALLMYGLIERPFRKKSGSGFSLLPRSYIKTVSVTAVVISVVGGHVWASHGWLWRLGERGELVRQFVAGERVADAAYGGDGCRYPPCSTTRDDRSPDVIFIGDSHSRQYFLGAKHALAGLKVDFHEFSSCQFYSVEYTRDYTGYPDPVLYDRGCRSARKRAFAAIRHSPNATVVLGEYWNPLEMVSEVTGKVVPLADPRQYYRFVAEEIERLQSELDVRRIVVLGSVPTAAGRGSPLDCYAALYDVDPACLTAPIAHPDITQRMKTNEMLQASLPSTAEFIDPFIALCDQATCAMMDDGPLYSDNTHLSGLGAKKVMSVFGPVIIGQQASVGDDPAR